MERSTNQLRAIATAMLILGLVVELVGITLLIMGKPVLSVTAVFVSGGVLLMLGVIFLAQTRRA